MSGVQPSGPALPTETRRPGAKIQPEFRSWIWRSQANSLNLNYLS